ncbi:MAG: hypothetical protein RIR90_1159 [Bacteroidota bacterium]|jgi:hypothetical protein
MKKIICAFVITICGLTAAEAQLSLPKSVQDAASSAVKNFVKPPAIGDVGKTTGSIVNELTSKLGLGAAQKPQLTDAIGSFLKDKSGILNLAGTNPKDYLAKFNPLQQGLFGKLKGILGAAKFADFLKLKPSGAGSALSNLFF